jgi:hypothetical protein
VAKGESLQEGSVYVEHQKTKPRPIRYLIFDSDIFSQVSLNGMRRELKEPEKAFTSHRRLERTELLVFRNITHKKKIAATHGRTGKP